MAGQSGVNRRGAPLRHRGNRVSDQGVVYLTFIEVELKAERDKRAAFDSRGQALVTTSGILVTALAGIWALVRPIASQPPPALAIVVLVLALMFFIIAASCGIAAGWNWKYALASASTLGHMVGARWIDDEVDARNNVASMHARTIEALRKANKLKAVCISVGLMFQVLALIALGVVVTLNVAAQT